MVVRIAVAITSSIDGFGCDSINRQRYCAPNLLQTLVQEHRFAISRSQS